MTRFNDIEKQHIVFLGESGFPYGLATIQRITLMARSFLNYGDDVTILCRKGVWKNNTPPNFNYKGNHDGIDYIYTSKSPYKPNGFIKRTRQKLKGILGEYQHLKKFSKNNNLDMIIVSEMKVVHILRYILYSYYFKVPLVANFVEMPSSMKHKAKVSRKINNYIHDKLIIKLYDAALPISDVLSDFYKIVAPKKKYMKLPILCDFDKFEIPKSNEEPYFLYCGTFKYKEVRDFVLESYKIASEKENIKLFMIISGGSKNEAELLQEELDTKFTKGMVKIFSNIPYQKLVELYVNATALLIPLRNTMQDKARFPHKIGEYLASGNPVITSSVGEIKNYFDDEKTALVAKSYSTEAFAEKMEFVLNNPIEAKKIGLAGKELGLKEFDYRAHSKRLQNFIRELDG